tara:strand:+ start:7292 stop:7918 length:627 start_codon:yes stop_codon:yes gene_type:complete
LKSQKILIFGGAFDPFHKGHLDMIKMVIKAMHINHVILMPNYMCPNKIKPLLRGDDRVSMLDQMIKEELEQKYQNVSFECSNYEIKQEKICYTSDTIRFLKEKNPNDTFYLLIGSDNLFSFHLWKNYQAIINQVSLCVVRRGLESKEQYQAYINDKFSEANDKPLFIFGKKPINISSSKIRECIKNNVSIDDLVPNVVAKAIQDKKGY